MADPFEPQGAGGLSMWELSGPELKEGRNCITSLNFTFDRDRGLEVALAGEGIDGVVTFPKAVTDDMLAGPPPWTDNDAVQAVLTRKALDVLAGSVGEGAGAAPAPPTGFEGERFEVNLEGDLITGSLSLSGPAVELILGEAPAQAAELAVEDAVAGKISGAVGTVLGEEVPAEAYASTGPVDEEALEQSAESPEAAIGEPTGFGEGAPDSEMDVETVQASAGEPEGFGEGAGPSPTSPGSGDVANVDLQNLQAQTAGDDAQAPAEEQGVGEAPTVEEVPIEVAPPEQGPLQVPPPVEEPPPEEAEEPPPEG
jgi:hypothetical protein